jgi:hypothetical protein
MPSTVAPWQARRRPRRLRAPARRGASPSAPGVEELLRRRRLHLGDGAVGNGSLTQSVCTSAPSAFARRRRRRRRGRELGAVGGNQDALVQHGVLRVAAAARSSHRRPPRVDRSPSPERWAVPDRPTTRSTSPDRAASRQARVLHREQVVAGGDARAARVDHLGGRAVAEQRRQLVAQRSAGLNRPPGSRLSRGSG